MTNVKTTTQHSYSFCPMAKKYSVPPPDVTAFIQSGVVYCWHLPDMKEMTRMSTQSYYWVQIFFFIICHLNFFYQHYRFLICTTPSPPQCSKVILGYRDIARNRKKVPGCLTYMYSVYSMGTLNLILMYHRKTISKLVKTCRVRYHRTSDLAESLCKQMTASWLASEMSGNYL